MRNSLSPFRYPGGKACLVPFLGSVIAENKLTFGTFVEPYAGSAAAAIHLLLGEHVEKIIINDYDYNIYCFWWSVLNQCDGLVKLIENTDITIDNWNRQRKIYDNPNRFSKVKVGFSTLFLNRCNRSGIIVSAGPIGGKSQSGRWKIDARFNKEEIINRIRMIASFSSRIELFNRDGVEFLRNIIQRRSSISNTLVFLDPPYFEKADGLYNTDFNYQKHLRLSKHLLSTANYKWILTYDYHKDAETLYRKRKPIKYVLPYSVNSKRKGSEILVRSPRLRLDSTYLPGNANCY